MCGIFGASAVDNVIPQLMQGLGDLEYRGYDSAGLGALENGRIVRRRSQGPVASLAELLEAEPLSAGTAIGHTRWATHGAPRRHNAHPHATARVAVVHNGIIENHAELRAELEQAGAQFRSDTDSEVVAWLLDRELATGTQPLHALQRVLPRLHGSYALALVCAGYDKRVFATRRGSPLAVARAGRAAWLASDAEALSRVAHEAVLLEDGHIAELRPGEVRLFDERLQEIEPSWRRIETSGGVLDRGQHATFTHKEIYEQPAILEQALAELTADLAAGRAARWCGPLWRAKRIVAVACGTSYYAAQTSRTWLEQVAQIPVDLELGSEFQTRQPILAEGTVALLVSQSGETADTLAALRYLRERNVPTVALVNVHASTMAMEADAVLSCRAGREVGVASTKAFTAQLFALAAASIAIRTLRGNGTNAELGDLLGSLSKVPEAVRGALELEESCAAVGRKLANAHQVIYLGRGASYPLALEGALKLKELSYVHAEGFAAGELKHGPLALVERGTPVIVVAPSDATFNKTLSNVREVLARGGEPVLVGDPHTASIAKRDGLPCIATPPIEPLWAPLVMAVPLQMLAYHAACAGDRNVDRPRNLAKSVTVE